MRAIVGFSITCALAAGACGGAGGVKLDGRLPGDAPADVPVDAPPDAPTCSTTTGAFPRAIPLPAGGEGSYDATFARDPATGRTWMVYSSVAQSPEALRLVSTRLAYSDDGGTTFCAAGTINAAAAVAAPAPDVTGTAYWNHEVPKLLFDPDAPAAERWRLVWQRYLIAAVASGDARQFQHSWIGERLAADPTALAAAPELKLLAGSLYAQTTAVATYNDSVIGPPEVRVDQLTAALADCAALTEPGALADAGARRLAISCETGEAASSRIVLLADDRAGHWTYTRRLLGQAEAQAVNPALDSFDGAELVTTATASYLIATPSVAGVDKGCIAYPIALPAGTLGTAVLGLTGTTAFAGPCGDDASLTVAGIVLGQADVSTTPPTFALVATGMTLP